MKKKEKKGIGCATILILLPIPGMIIYGLATDSFDLAQGFKYGCIVSLVFLIFSIISAIKNKADNPKTENATESRTTGQKEENATESRTAGLVAQTVRIKAPDRKGEGRIVLPEAQKKLLSKQLQRLSALLPVLILLSASFMRPYAGSAADNPPDGGNDITIKADDTNEYEQYNSILFVYQGNLVTTKSTNFVPKTVDEEEYTDADGVHVFHRTLKCDVQDADNLIAVYFAVWGYAPGVADGKSVFQQFIEYRDDKVITQKTEKHHSYDDDGSYETGALFTVTKDSTGAKIITEIKSSKGDKVILELLLGEAVSGEEDDNPGHGTVIHTDASDEKGEMPGFVIPAAVAAAVLLGLGIIIGKGKKKNKQAENQKESEEDKEENEEVSYEMRVYKEFGDTINVGDDAVVYARMVAIYPDGSEKTDPSLTARINIYPKAYLSLTSKQMAGDYMGAVVSAPLADNIPEETVIVFDLEGIYKVEMSFRIGDCIFVADPATGAEEFFTEDRKTGEWVRSDGKTILNLSSLADWISQRQSDREWIDRQNEKLRTNDTAFDRMLHEGDAAFNAEQRKIEEETAEILNNLRKYGTLDTDEAHIREIIAREQRLHAIEGRRSARQAVVYDVALWAATVTKYGTDKAFDFFANYGGGAGKLGKAIYVLATDQAGALEDARLNGKSMGAAAGKALTGSLYSIGKDYFDGGAKAVYVIGGRAAEAMAGALIDGKGLRGGIRAVDESIAKSAYELTTELVGETLGDMADEAGFIKTDGKNIYSIAVGNSDIIQTGFNDLTAKIYDSSAEALDKSIEAHKRNH